MNITNDKITDYIQSFYKPLNQELKELREEAEERYIPIILEEMETFLISLLHIIKPKSILEVGTAIGYSSAVMAKVLDDVRIDTIESFEKSYWEAKANIEKFNLNDRVNVILGDATKDISKIDKDTYDFIFVDASKSRYMDFWDEAIKKSKKGTVIVCDNVLMKASIVDSKYDPTGRFKTSIKKMKEFLHHISTTEEVETSILAVGDGVSISYVK